MNKHIELFKQIPCGNFGPSKLFFDEFKDKQPKDITIDDIFLAYYYISEEMMNSEDSRRFIVRKDTLVLDNYQYHDPLTDAQDETGINYRPAKVYKGVIKHYDNRVPKGDYYGLVATPKIPGEKIAEIIEDFRIFADSYKTTHFRRDIFTNERRYCLGEKELNHLYSLLKTLCDKANFCYKQAGSIILAQELANVMANHKIIEKSQNTTGGIEYVRQHKMFMFGELQKQH